MSTGLAPAQPYDGVEHVDLPAVPLAAIRHDGVTFADLAPLFDAGFATLGALAASGALTPVAPAVAIYHGDPRATFDLEIAFPVDRAPDTPLGDAGQVRASSLPAGPAAAATHHGAYDGLRHTWGALVGGADGEPAGVWIEVYVTDPREPGELRTDLLMPLR